MPSATSPRQWIGPLLLFLGLLVNEVRAAETLPPRPADVTINPEAGRGGLLLMKVRFADGSEAGMIVDTGSPTTLLDDSLASKLGKSSNTITAHTFNYLWEAKEYAAPKIFLGDVPLMLGPAVITVNMQKALPQCPASIKGILGMDCLRHYCVQLDFQSKRIRFLDPAGLNTSTLGKSYHLAYLANAGWSDVPVIAHAGLLGGTGTNTIVDTGDNCDAMSPEQVIRRGARGSYTGGMIKRFKHFLAVQGWVDVAVALPHCEWDGNTYTNIVVAHGPPQDIEWLGLAFLARHLVTFDFPHDTLYLKQTSVGPLKKSGRTEKTGREK